jgi:hypothetical protein
LKWNPRGGLYIAGGIAPKNLDHFLHQNLFMACFLDKEGRQDMLKSVSTSFLPSFHFTLFRVYVRTLYNNKMNKPSKYCRVREYFPPPS